MGVSGSGKSTIGRLLSARLNCKFVDADDLHPAQNREKMKRGIPLLDEDRVPWLESLAGLIREHLRKDEPLILACSALKKDYRARLGVDGVEVRTVYLKGKREELAGRLSHRKHAFFDPALLDSQLATLEEPDSGLILPMELPPEELVERISRWIGKS